mgnify:CR=1 FL=1
MCGWLPILWLPQGAKAQTRADQVKDWMGGKKADGCMLFDESHKAKNLVPESVRSVDSGAAAPTECAPLPAGIAQDLSSRCYLQVVNTTGIPTKKSSSQTGIVCQQLQRDLRLARVVYCSATGASSLPNMAYMERLGLWGDQTAFATFGHFSKAVGDGGEPIALCAKLL